MIKYSFRSLLLIASLFIAPGVLAQSDNYQYGTLTIIDATTHKSIAISPEQFADLPQSQITTSTPWLPKTSFSGVSFKDLLKLSGFKGEILRVHALNDYWVDIPMSDVNNYNLLLANKNNGELFNIRDFGPYFVIYPVDSEGRELNKPVYFSRFVWQVESITVIDK